jgi:hypothetical protein
MKLSAGQNIQVSIFAIVLLADSGKIFVFADTNPITIQIKRVSIGVSVARKVAIILLRKSFSNHYNSESENCQ